MSVYVNEKIKKYSNEMPDELKRAMGALNDDIRLAIFFVLLKYGDLPFSQIMKELEIPPDYSSKLTYHIKKLQKGGLIKNEYVKKKGTDSYSFYDITEFGKEILNNLIDTIVIPSPSESTTEKYLGISAQAATESNPTFRINQSETLFIENKGVIDTTNTNFSLELATK